MLPQVGPQIDDIVDVESVTAADVGTAVAVVVISIVLAVVVRRLLSKRLKEPKSDSASTAVAAPTTVSTEPSS